MSQQTSPTKRLIHQGNLSLKFTRRGGKTVLTDCYQTPPLRASRALYMNSSNPSEATVYLVETSGGLLAGDENNFHIEVKENADVCLIPQSATKIYPSFNGMWSTQNIDISIRSKGSLTWKTEATIPFEQAKFRGKTNIRMAKDAKLLWGEILAPGRLKRGEVFHYNDVKTNFQVWMEDECLIFDPLLFSPSRTNLRQLGLLEDHLYVGSMWLVSSAAENIDIKQLNEQLQQLTEMKASAAILEGKAVNVRWLASDLVNMKKEMDRVWDLLSQY